MRADPLRSSPDQVIGRYALFREIASGGMAAVHLGRLMGPAGFSRVVAIKRLHPHLARDPEFLKMFVDEARLAARVQHPNVVPTLDIVAENGELFIVMEYVDGESLARLARLANESGQRIPVPIVAAVMLGALQGLHAAHEARDEDGRPLELVHRDISPQNVLVGVDGLPRVVDFGVAKAVGRSSQTSGGMLKGKLPYMSPEQLLLDPVDRRTDLYAVSIVLWEMLAGRRLFTGGNDWEIASRIKAGILEPPSAHNPEVSAALDQIVLRGGAAAPDARFATALEMADALEHAVPIAASRAIGRYVESIAADSLVRRRQLLAEAESVKSDITIVGGGSVVTPADARTVARPGARASSELTSSTRLGGAFAGQATPAVSAPIHSRPSSPAPHSQSGVSSTYVPEEGPATAAGWSTVVQRRLSAPMLGVIAGALIAATIGVIALVVRLASSDDAPAVTAIPSPAAEPPAVVEQPKAEPVVPTAEPATDPPVPQAEEPDDAPPAVADVPRPAAPTSPPKSPATQPTASETAPTKPPKKARCDPPWYKDKDGEKHFLPECLSSK